MFLKCCLTPANVWSNLHHLVSTVDVQEVKKQGEEENEEEEEEEMRRMGRKKRKMRKMRKRRDGLIQQSLQMCTKTILLFRGRNGSQASDGWRKKLITEQL